MKRISIVLTVLIMLSMCAQSFGYFLIYNLSTTVKGADDGTGLKSTVPLKGYLVLSLDSGGNFVDANLILYGKDVNNPLKEKKLVLLNHDGMPILNADLWYIGETFFIELSAESPTPFDFKIMLSGKTKIREIGDTELRTAASNLKGVTIVRREMLLGPFGDQDFSGTGNASATLWMSATKFVNTNNWTPEEIILNGRDEEPGLIEILTAKGYTGAMWVM